MYVFFILPQRCSHFWFWLLCFSQVALLTIVYKKKAGQPSCYYRHLKKRRVEKEKANRGANKQVNRRSTFVTLATLAFARLVALLLLKNIIIYIKKIKKKKVRKSKKYMYFALLKKSRSTVQLKTYSVKHFPGCFAFVYKSKSRATVKNSVYLYLIITLIHSYFTPRMFISNSIQNPFILHQWPTYTPSLTRYNDLSIPYLYPILNPLTNPQEHYIILNTTK